MTPKSSASRRARFTARFTAAVCTAALGATLPAVASAQMPNPLSSMSSTGSSTGGSSGEDAPLVTREQPTVQPAQIFTEPSRELTAEELHDLAQRQAMAGTID